MVDNIRSGADAHANHVIDLMRAGETAGELGRNVELSPDIRVNADEALGLGGRWSSPRGDVLRLEPAYGGAGNWFALVIALRAPDLSRVGVVGFALRARASQTCHLGVALRSGTADGFVDARFDKPVMLREREAVHVDGLGPRGREDVPVQAPWRQLLVFLPTSEVTAITVHDLRVFIV